MGGFQQSLDDPTSLDISPNPAGIHTNLLGKLQAGGKLQWGSTLFDHFKTEEGTSFCHGISIYYLLEDWNRPVPAYMRYLYDPALLSFESYD